MESVVFLPSPSASLVGVTRSGIEGLAALDGPGADAASPLVGLEAVAAWAGVGAAGAAGAALEPG